MLNYEFMQRAFIVGILVSIIIPCIGAVVVFKRLSMIGDALSHSSLAGVAGGLLLGIHPILGAILFCVIAALAIEYMRKKIPHHAELSIAIIMSAAIGLAGIFSGLVSSVNFNSYLFGSIVSISDFEVGVTVFISMVILLTFLLLYKELFYIAFDERAARLAGVPVSLINVLFTILTAITISISARTVGALIISSLMVIPTVCAMQIARSYKQTILYAILFALSFTIAGLTISFYTGLKPGGMIVLLGVLVLLLLLLGKNLRFRRL